MLILSGSCVRRRTRHRVAVDIPSVAAGLWATLSPDPIGPLDVVGPRVVLATTFDVTGLAAASIGVATAAAARCREAPRGGRTDRSRRHRAGRRRRSRARLGSARGLGTRGRVGSRRRRLPRRRRLDPPAHELRPPPARRSRCSASPTRRAPGATTWRARSPAGRRRRWSNRSSTGRRGCRDARSRAVADAAPRCRDRRDRASRDRRRRRRRPTAPVAHGSPGPHPLSGVRRARPDPRHRRAGLHRFLAGHGADVLRIDPPGFAEVPPCCRSSPPASAARRSTSPQPEGGHRFAELVADADVLVHGMRPGALERLGFGADALRRINPALVDAGLDAYGWTGPWAGRRGLRQPRPDELRDRRGGRRRGRRRPPRPVAGPGPRPRHGLPPPRQA